MAAARGMEEREDLRNADRRAGLYAGILGARIPAADVLAEGFVGDRRRCRRVANRGRPQSLSDQTPALTVRSAPSRFSQ